MYSCVCIYIYIYISLSLSLSRWTGGWRAGGCRAGGGWRAGGVAGGGMLQYSAVRTGSVCGHRISDTNGSVSDALRYAIKVLLKQP